MSASRLVANIRRNPLILPFYLPALITAFSMGVLIPVLPLYAGDFNVSYGLVGLVLAGEALGMLLGDVPAGLLGHRLGLKGTMLLGLGCIALSTGALFWAGTIPAVVLCRVIAGFGRSLYNVSRHAYITGVVHPGIRGRTIALLGGIFRVGRFVGPMIGGIVAARHGLRAPFLLFAGISGIALLAVVSFVPASTGTPHLGPQSSRSRGSHLLSSLRTRYGILAPAGAAQLFAQMIRAGRGIIIPLYGADVIGLDVGTIGLVVSLASAVDMSLFYPAGLIMDRLGRKYAIVPSFLVQALGMSLLPLTGSFVGLLAVASLIGLGNGLGSGSMMTLGSDLAPRGSHAEFLGIWRWIGDAGSTGGPLVVGAIAELVVLPTAALVMGGAGLIAAMVFIFFVPETLETRDATT
jgi:MFS family permease